MMLFRCTRSFRWVNLYRYFVIKNKLYEKFCMRSIDIWKLLYILIFIYIYIQISIYIYIYILGHKNMIRKAYLITKFCKNIFVTKSYKNFFFCILNISRNRNIKSSNIFLDITIFYLLKNRKKY
jgi:hypothetical protein